MGLPLAWAGLTNREFALKLPLQGLCVPSDTARCQCYRALVYI